MQIPSFLFLYPGETLIGSNANYWCVDSDLLKNERGNALHWMGEVYKTGGNSLSRRLLKIIKHHPIVIWLGIIASDRLFSFLTKDLWFLSCSLLPLLKSRENAWYKPPRGHSRATFSLHKGWEWLMCIFFNA